MKKIKTAVLFLGAAIYFLPLVYLLIPSFAGYRELLFSCFLFYPMFWNGLGYALAVSLAQMIILVPAAFGLYLWENRKKEILFFVFVVLMMMPLQVTLLPNYIGLRELGLLNTRAGIVLPLIFSPFEFVIIYQYMRGMEKESIEAARLETGSTGRILLHIVIPQAKYGIMAAFLFGFVETYNILEQPMLFLKEDSKRTLSVFAGQTETYSSEVLSAACVLYTIPVLFLFLKFQKSLREGLEKVKDL